MLHYLQEVTSNAGNPLRDGKKLHSKILIITTSIIYAKFKTQENKL